MIHVEVRSSDASAALEHLYELRNCDQDCGVRILIDKIEGGLNAIRKPSDMES